uniref:Uncharacterized protein n=1 Tax=Setaria viridis TaxID=4556 RepID=A0A4U6UDL2_SETVI|nr:hypothetical protein SEVIR_5G145800v2 [Setaria viridis]
MQVGRRIDHIVGTAGLVRCFDSDPHGKAPK